MRTLTRDADRSRVLFPSDHHQPEFTASFLHILSRDGIIAPGFVGFPVRCFADSKDYWLLSVPSDFWLWGV